MFLHSLNIGNLWRCDAMKYKKIKVSIPFWDSDITYKYEVELGPNHFDDLAEQGFALQNEVGHNSIFEVSLYWNKDKDIHFIEIWDGEGQIFTFMCKSKRKSMECFHAAVKLALEWGKK